ncbi:Uncharacterized conserved protein (COG2071) [Acinetobacter marinus]|uniref:Uncharacterized conserved protein (COG2071) n=1 Tax=Acinetobacter marinus TaxID=281375 RepID=A0A1G6JPF3_9GAMM|nr:DUF2071 domain-containing protein [Acinetobacter marinus]SDC20609.1 Uncharacterized conserved protein (COG2071) [Acinetobacter marinus]
MHNSEQSVRRFHDVLQPRPKATGIDVQCALQHFALITYAIAPEKFQQIIPERFQLDTILYNGKAHVLMSVVPFIDVDFTSAVYPFPKFTMGQTNYRVYVIDRETGERCVWFIGTTLDSWTIVVPRHLWMLPWHRAKIDFDCEFDAQQNCYRHYHMRTQSDWANAELRLTQSTEDTWQFEGFPDLESFQVYLTHPLAGFYHRRDGKLGSYRVWHDRLNPQPAQLNYAKFDLLERMGLVSFEDQQHPYSVLIEPINHFTIYLPPTVY